MSEASAWHVMEPEFRPSNSRRLHVLCAEDNTMVGDMLLRLLAISGYAPELARDGQAAWERVSADPGKFDLILTDHHMPRCDGLELVRRLRDASFPGRIIVHSNALGPAELEAYMALGVDAIVAKASSGNDILRIIASVCGNE